MGPVRACFRDVLQLAGVARHPRRDIGAGFVAGLCIVPIGDKIAPGKVASRVLTASLTPRKVFGGGEARRKLARRAFLQTHAAWGLLLALFEQPFLPKTEKIAT